MGFLWQLLPGAREARNQVIVGYAWLLAIGLVVGVPRPDPTSPLGELVDTLGPVGIGIGLSFAAFLLGSFSDDLVQVALRQRGGRSITRLSDESPVLVIRRIQEWGVKSETEGLEASIDRLNAEIVMRLGLIPPVYAIGMIAVFGYDWHWLFVFAPVLILILWQVLRRRSDLAPDMARVESIGESLNDALARDPEAVEWRAERQRQLEERERQLEAERKTKYGNRPPTPSLTPEQLRDLNAESAKRIAARPSELAELETRPITQLSRTEARKLRELLFWSARLEQAGLEWQRAYLAILTDLHRDLGKLSRRVSRSKSRNRRTALPTDIDAEIST